ncbi:BTAD domain-containing putative transcriptional regulator [Streptomyces sp. NPDC087659]|uniref:BTAD domain-containing putative transcriptional regulator n=1 Tax=Streptomyces sp. NPDC087659 TaxID=3365801 RepID=UPI0038138E5F
MRFKLLGPLRLARGEETVFLQSSKPTSLLATLLLHSGSMVSSDYLLHAVWDETPPPSARSALQSCVLRLRRLFKKHGTPSDIIEAVSGGYRVSADAGSLDLIEFRAWLASARAARAAEIEVHALRTALAMWDGPILANVPSPMLHRDVVPHLTEQRLQALERLCDIELARGRCGQVLMELWEAARLHPERERFSEQLIEALYRTGRQSEALAEYQAVKHRLNEGLGIDPSATLQRLELAMLRGDDLGPTVTGPLTMPDTQRTTLSVIERRPAVPGFTGRVAELSRLTELLARDRAQPGPIVISGAPGIGKTALALQAMHETQTFFPGGCFTLQMTAPDGMALTSADVLAQLPQNRERPPSAAYARSLLILDDAVSADQVRPVWRTFAYGTLVVTSRHRLSSLVATDGGSVIRLDTLAPDESCELLACVLGKERAQNEADGSRELARVCGHFPLSLRIAAAHLLTRPDLGIGEWAAWLSDDTLTRLTLTDDDQLSVSRVFARALDRLRAPLREAFHIAAAGPDRLTASACSASLTDEVLEYLADAGFLEEGPPGSYRMHELLRAYARRQRQESTQLLPATDVKQLHSPLLQRQDAAGGGSTGRRGGPRAPAARQGPPVRGRY